MTTNTNALITDLLSILKRGEATEQRLQRQLMHLGHSCTVAQWDALIDQLLDDGVLVPSMIDIAACNGQSYFPTLSLAA